MMACGQQEHQLLRTLLQGTFKRHETRQKTYLKVSATAGVDDAMMCYITLTLYGAQK